VLISRLLLPLLVLLLCGLQEEGGAACCKEHAWPTLVVTALLLLLLCCLQEEGGAARPGGLTELSWSVGIRRVEVLEPLLDMFYNKT
jgi:hypothetical protein